MTYNVFDGMLNPTLLLLLCINTNFAIIERTFFASV